MARFVAIPVGQGDAFYLDLGEFSVLVDGGRNTRTFYGKFRQHTNASNVDVVVCTHNDADHANGILGLIRDGLPIKELWLPGSWAGVLEDALKPFREILKTLMGDIIQIGDAQGGLDRLATDSPCEQKAGETGRQLLLGVGGWPESALSLIEDARSAERPPEVSGDLRRLLDPKPIGIKYSTSRVCIESKPRLFEWLKFSIMAARRIREIATEAAHRHIPVRWFEFTNGVPSGGCAYLRPVNAREIVTCAHFPSGSLLYRLSLTIQNKRSLVFWAPPAETHAGVLFTADSDIAGLQLPTPLCGAIITAPHHGSEVNKDAYATIQGAALDHTASLMWVRSDGNYKKRPGPTYLALHGLRFCTRCRRTTGPKEPGIPVEFSGTGYAWVANQKTALCSCSA